MLITNANIDAAFVGFDTDYQQVFKDTPIRWDKIATEKPSKTETQRHLWGALIPEMREFLGERVFNNVAGRSQDIINKEWELSVAMKRAKFEDDQYGIYADSVRQLAMRAKQWPDKLVTDALKNGDTAVVYDGQHFFDTAHPQDPDNPASPTMANKFTAKPLTSDNISAVRAAMMAFTDDAGVPMEIVPNLLVVPPQLEFQARQILFGTTIALPVGTAGTSPGGAAAPDNVLKGMMDLLVLPRLTDATKYYLMDTTRSVKPLIFQNRMAPEFAYLNRPDDSEVFKRSEFLFGIRSRGNAGYGPWFLAAEVVTV